VLGTRCGGDIGTHLSSVSARVRNRGRGMNIEESHLSTVSGDKERACSEEFTDDNRINSNPPCEGGRRRPGGHHLIPSIGSRHKAI
jgi:hypothetical protein